MAKQQVKSLDELEREIAGLNMRGQWQYEAAAPISPDGPKPAGVPYVWKWPTVYAKLMDACEAMPESFTARRALTFTNPGLPKPGSTHTIVMAVQMVTPGEIAWSHRHTMGAIRFAIDGDARLYTAVDGERWPMEANDLVLTPSWTWHDHHNESDHAGTWLDVLDVPMTFMLNQAFYEPYGKDVYPRRSGGKLLRYAWRDVRPLLAQHAQAACDPHDGTILEYVDPSTGGSTLPTLGCFIQSLPPGFQGEASRRTSSAVYYVVSGRGRSIVGDDVIEWSERDAFAVPNWMRCRHINDSASDEAILFSVTDRPVLTALGMYRSEPAYGERPAAVLPSR